MAAQTLAVNEQNDLYLDSAGNIAVIYDLAGTLQACAHATKTILGEMLLAVNEGIPNFQTVWVGVPNLQQFEASIRSAILKVVGVVEIVSFIMEQNAETLDYSVVIRTIYGTGSVTNG